MNPHVPITSWNTYPLTTDCFTYFPTNAPTPWSILKQIHYFIYKYFIIHIQYISTTYEYYIIFIIDYFT